MSMFMGMRSQQTVKCSCIRGEGFPGGSVVKTPPAVQDTRVCP